jgi:hypothetical protein
MIWMIGNMEFSQPIQYMLSEKNITDYLDEQGISPHRQSGDRVTYRCPLHKSDKIPSFVVYINGGREYQTYYCFGCNSGGSIIQLMSALEGIPVREIMKKFSSEFKIDEKTALEIACNELETLLEYHPIKEDDILMKLSHACYLFLQEVSFDKEEFDFLDGILQKIDKVIQEKDTKTLDKIYRFLSDKALGYRCSQYYERREQEALDTEEERELWKNV